MNSEKDTSTTVLDLSPLICVGSLGFLSQSKDVVLGAERVSVCVVSVYQPWGKVTHMNSASTAPQLPVLCQQPPEPFQ